jgi:hypothetical protein
VGSQRPSRARCAGEYLPGAAGTNTGASVAAGKVVDSNHIFVIYVAKIYVLRGFL